MTVHVHAAADPGAGPLTFYDVLFELTQRRAAVHAELEELRAAGEPIAVPPDAVFLCELLGLVVDLRTGVLVGGADERPNVAVTLSELRRIVGAAA